MGVTYPLYFYGNRGYKTLYNLSLEACNACFFVLSMGKHAPSRLITSFIIVVKGRKENVKQGGTQGHEPNQHLQIV